MERRFIPCWHNGTNKVLVVGRKHGYNQTGEERGMNWKQQDLDVALLRGICAVRH